MSLNVARAWLCALATLAWGSPAVLAAQDSVTVAALLGREVRVLAPRVAGREVVGRVVATDPSGLAVVTGKLADTVAVPVETIERLRLRAGSHGGVRGGVLGGVAGALVGVTVYRLWASEAYSNHEYLGLGSLVIGAPAGALVGGVAGALLGAHAWRDVRLRR